MINREIVKVTEPLVNPKDVDPVTKVHEQPERITTLKSVGLVAQIDLGEPFSEAWKLINKCDSVVMANRAGMKIPPSIVASIFEIDPECPSANFVVQVNKSKQTTLRYTRYDLRARMNRRLRVFAVFTLLKTVKGVEKCLGSSIKGANFVNKVSRRLFRFVENGAERVQKTLLSSKLTTSSKLNGYVLTDRFDEMAEFNFPAALHVALTKNCNLKCIMCPYHSEELRGQHTTDYFKKASRLPKDILESVIEEAGRHKAHLSFGQYDEPFIYKNFAEWAVRAKEAGCTVSITTNGTLLDAKAAELLLSAGIDQISFSLDAASHETYREIRLDDFEVPLENLRRISKLKKEIGSSTQLRACLVVQDENKHEQQDFYDLINGLGLDMVSFYNLTTYENGIWDMPVLNFGVDADTPETRSVCSQLYDQMAIYPDGNVALCCLTTMYVGYRDDVPYVGNLRDSSLQKLWHSATYNRIRSEAFQGQFSNSVCRDCTIWHNYQGRYSVNEHGHKVYQNAYETIIYLN